MILRCCRRDVLSRCSTITCDKGFKRSKKLRELAKIEFLLWKWMSCARNLELPKQNFYSWASTSPVRTAQGHCGAPSTAAAALFLVFLRLANSWKSYCWFMPNPWDSASDTVLSKSHCAITASDDASGCAHASRLTSWFLFHGLRPRVFVCRDSAANSKYLRLKIFS